MNELHLSSQMEISGGGIGTVVCCNWGGGL